MVELSDDNVVGDVRLCIWTPVAGYRWTMVSQWRPSAKRKGLSAALDRWNAGVFRHGRRDKAAHDTYERTYVRMNVYMCIYIWSYVYDIALPAICLSQGRLSNLVPSDSAIESDDPCTRSARHAERDELKCSFIKDRATSIEKLLEEY